MPASSRRRDTAGAGDACPAAPDAIARDSSRPWTILVVLLIAAPFAGERASCRQSTGVRTVNSPAPISVTEEHTPRVAGWKVGRAGQDSSAILGPPRPARHTAPRGPGRTARGEGRGMNLTYWRTW